MFEEMQKAQNYEAQEALFDEEYFRTGCGPTPYGHTAEWLSFFGQVADHIVRSLRPKRVFDAGCAMGLLVEALWDRGVEARGIDISPYAISRVRRDMVQYCSLGSLCQPVPGRFDLITCIEVVEHVPAEETELIVANLCSASDLVLFSSTPFDFDEPTHRNIRPLIQWLKIFGSFGFWPDLLFDASFISNHAMLLRRDAVPSSDEALSLFCKSLHLKTGLAEKFKENGDLSGRMDGWRRKCDLLEAQHTGILDTLSVAKASEALLNNRLHELDCDRAALTEKVQGLEVEKGALAGRIEELEGDRAVLTEKVQGLEVGKAALADRIVELEADRAAFSARLQDADKDPAQKLAGLTAPNQSLREAALGSQRVVRDLIQERNHLTKTLTVSNNRQQQLEIAFQRSIEEQTASRERLRLLERELQNAQARHRALAAEVESIQCSPGWQAVNRYRTWRMRFYAKHPRFMKYYERLAVRLLSDVAAPGSNERGAAQRVVEVVPRPAAGQDDMSRPAAMSSFQPPNEGFEVAETLKCFLLISGCPGDAVRYRRDHQAEELRFFGLTVDTALFDEVDYRDVVLRYEAFLLHRVPYTPGIEEFINVARALGKPVIFDTDDLVFNEALIGDIKGLRDFSPDERNLYIDGVRRYRHTLSLCSAALVTTEHLRESIHELFPNIPVFLNRNAVSEQMVCQADEALGSVEPPADGLVRLAYFSGTRTHQDDFAECEGALARLMSKYPEVRLMVVGHLDIPKTLVPVAARIETIPLVPWGDLPALMRRVDINLAPLEMVNRFTAAKSELKYFEAGLLGVPTVASAVPSYRYAIAHGENGLLAANPDEWFEQLESLVLDKERRIRLGQSARRDVLSRYTTRVRAPELFETMRQIFDQHGLSGPQPISVAFVARAPIAQTGGGYKNIFVLAQDLAAKGHDVHIYIEAIAHLAGKTEAEAVDFCHRYFGESPAKIHLGHDNIWPSDVAIATNWPTAYTVNRLNNTRCRMYLIQDYEPDFYEPGEPQYLEADKTYALPLRKIALGKYLGALFSRRDQIPVPAIKFSLDRSLFMNRHLRSATPPVKILFFARPGLKRRAYSVGAAALRLVAKSCPEARIAFYGMAQYEDLGFPYENLGELSREEVANAMNTSHVHLSFSLTNISWVPFEAMACGCAVVEAKVPSVELWMDGETETCLLVDPTPETVARGVIRLVEDSGLRQRLAKNGELYIDSIAATWEKTCRIFERILLESVFRIAEP